MDATSTILMSMETGTFLLFGSLTMLTILLFLLYIIWPTSHKDFYEK